MKYKIHSYKKHAYLDDGILHTMRLMKTPEVTSIDLYSYSGLSGKNFWNESNPITDNKIAEFFRDKDVPEQEIQTFLSKDETLSTP